MTVHNALELLDRSVEVPFNKRLARDGAMPLITLKPTVMQLNLGYRCNQECAHCHIEAGPDRTEEMTWDVMERTLEFADELGITEFDLTGGAPELNPNFRKLVTAIRSRDWDVITRTNLTILSEPGLEDIPQLLADNEVRVVASLPHYSRGLTDRVRGKGVFELSIEGIRKLNELGYGDPDSGLELTLVYNPAGAILPGCQDALEADFRTQLARSYGLKFTSLIALTNNPTGRFLEFLKRSGNLDQYMCRLEQNFNPATVPNLMCLTTISVGWDGTLYDCDFNQALRLRMNVGGDANILRIRPDDLLDRAVCLGSHCYGCTAGQGSSCGGAVAE